MQSCFLVPESDRFLDGLPFKSVVATAGQAHCYRARHRSVFLIGAATALVFSTTPDCGNAQGVGTIPATFEVSSSGGARYTIPIRVAPGTAGTAPILSLTYDSHAGTGPLGAGWSLGGASTITRGPKTIHSDGLVDGVRLSDEDALYLDGQRLIPIAVAGTGAAQQTVYRKEADDLTKVTQLGAALNSARFEVRTKGGVTLLFDASNGSTIRLTDGTALLWSVSRIYETSGNYIDFHYQQNGYGDFTLSSIRYTGHELRDAAGNVLVDRSPFAAVEFEFETLLVPSEAYVAGRLLRRTYRLKSITSRVAQEPDAGPTSGWSEASRYELEYEPRSTGNRFVLSRVRQFGSDGVAIQPTTFLYSEGRAGWQEAGWQLPVAVLAAEEKLAGGFRFATVADGAGPDLLFAALVQGKLEAFAFKNSGGTWEALEKLKPPVAFVSDAGADLGALMADLDGDGKTDLVQSYRAAGEAGGAAYLARVDGWDAAPGYTLPFPISIEGRRTGTFLLAPFSNPTRPDLLFDVEGVRGFLANSGTQWNSDAEHALPVALSRATRALDVDCDGRPEFVTPVGAEWHAYRFDLGGWTLLPAPFALPVPTTLPPEAVTVLDLNGDGCKDVITSDAQTGLRIAIIASALGWHEDASKIPPFDLVDAAGSPLGALNIDVDRDGRMDVLAHRRDEQGRSVRFAFAQTVTGWRDLGADFVLPVLLELNVGQVPLTPLVGDLDGDGYQDLARPAGYRGRFGQVFAGTAAGFVEKPEYVPPVAFARKDQQDRGVRFIDLNADGLPDVLFRRDVTKDGATTTQAGAYLNTGHGWQLATGLVPPHPFAADWVTGDPAHFADVDADGYLDLLYSYRRANGATLQAYYRNEREPDGSRRWVEQPGSGLTPPITHPFAVEKGGSQGSRLVDLNGDGRTDLLIGAVVPRSADNPQPVQTCPPGGRQCELNRALFEGTAFLNDGIQWVETPAFKPPVPFVAKPPSASDPAWDLFTETLDIDGDGLPDLVASFRHPHDTQRAVNEIWLNTGQGWRASALRVPVALDTVYRDDRASVLWSDLNSDGLADVVLSRRRGDVNGSQSWLSTGAGFVETTVWRVPLSALADRAGDQGFRIMDLNGDGYVDVIYSRAGAAEQVERGAYLNSGVGWIAGDEAAVAGVPAVIDADGRDQGVRFVDVDGNGMPDIIMAFTRGDGLIAERRAFVNTARRSEVLTEVSAGYGAITRVAYQSLIEVAPTDTAAGQAPPWQQVYEPGEVAVSYPVIAPVPASYVVRQTTMEIPGELSRQFYRYGQFRMHVTATRPLGYGWRESYNEVSALLARTEFNQALEQAGRPEREATCWVRFAQKPAAARLPSDLCPADAASHAWITKLSETTSRWTTATFSPALSVPAHRIRHTLLADVSVSVWELDGQLVSRETTALTYDAPANFLGRHQNVTETRVQRLDGSSVTTINEYEDDESRWHFGRLTRATFQKTGDLVGVSSPNRKSESSTVAYTYNRITGLLASSTIAPGDQKALTTTHERDRFGNITRTTVSAPGERQRAEGLDYDALGRFVIAEYNALGHQTRYARDPLTGHPTSVTDPNNVTTKYTYDGLGRAATETSPSGILTRVERVAADQLEPAAVAGIRAAYAERVTVGGLPPSMQIYDAYGRLVRAVMEGFTLNDTGRRPVHVDWMFDRLGRIERSTLPYDRGESPIVLTTQYDVLNRAIELTRSDGEVLKTEYRGLAKGGHTVRSVDAAGRQTLITLNGRALPIVVEDDAGGKVRYEYDAGDRLELVVGPTGAVTRTTYDSRGARESMSDPDIGLRTYKYDAFGQLREQVDAKGHGTLFAYDELGRLERRSHESGETVSWHYDGAQNGIGRLERIHDPRGYERNFFYDSYGRSVRTAETLGTETFVTSVDYDEYGRVRRTRYPVTPGASPVIAEHKYDRKGFLVRVTGSNGVGQYWQALDLDVMGRTLKEQYGNGVETLTGYDENTGLLTSIKTRAPGGAAVLDLGLRYDKVGSLLARNDAVRGFQETFAYDRIDRLRTFSRVGAAATTIDYDAAGRILKHSRVGSYEYVGGCAVPGSQPYHAVQATRKVGGVKSSYCYDANGNRETGDGRNFTYTGDNRLQLVRLDDAHWARFDYEPGGHRYRQVSRDDDIVVETLYSGAFERIRELHPEDTSRVKEIRLRYYLLNVDGAFAVIEARQQPGNGLAAAASTVSTKVWYLHKDQLGSVIRVTNETGALAARFWFDPWGRQTEAAPLLAAGHGLGALWRRGFTEHEHLREVGLIHMNGRVYDPETGMFVSPDPIGLATGYTQSMGRYAYAIGNPLKYTDPTGYFLKKAFKTLAGGAIGFFVGGPAGAVAGAMAANDGARRWVQQNWREIATVTVAVAVTVATGGAGAVVAGMAAGAAAGGTRAALYGGDLGDILEGAVRGGVIGGVSGAAFFAAGEVFSGAAESIVSHGVIGGGISELEGGDFHTGFVAGALTKASSAYGPTFRNHGMNVARAAAVGGTVAAVSGGKFANGAILGAYSYAFNDALHRAAEEYESTSFSEQYPNFLEVDVEFRLRGKVGPFSGTAGAEGYGLGLSIPTAVPGFSLFAGGGSSGPSIGLGYSLFTVSTNPLQLPNVTFRAGYAQYSVSARVGVNPVTAGKLYRDITTGFVPSLTGGAVRFPR